jgi:hypothetical protein
VSSEDGGQYQTYDPTDAETETANTESNKTMAKTIYDQIFGGG